MPYKNKEDQQKWEDRYRKDYLNRPETKKLVQERKQKLRQRNKDFVQSKISPCICCGNSDPDVIDFHHLDPNIKEKGISEMVYGSRSLKSIQTELDKCVCVCSNCHRKIHLGNLTLL